MKRLRALPGAALIALGFLLTASAARGQSAVGMIWSASTGLGSPGGPVIAAAPGDQLTLDVELGIDALGVRAYAFDLRFDTDLIDELDILSITTIGSPYAITSGPTFTQDSTGAVEGQFLNISGSTIMGAPGPCVMCTVNVARIIFLVTANIQLDGEDVVGSAAPNSFMDDLGAPFTPLFAGAIVDPFTLGAPFMIDPRATYLRTNMDAANPTQPIPLVAVAAQPGDQVRVERLGDWAANTPGPDTQTAMIAVFSASATLLTPPNLNRVQDALEAGIDFTTLPTFAGSLTTDISQDFFVDDVVVSVPSGASHIFVAVSDNKYGDNSDPDGDLAVRITVVDVVPALTLWSAPIAAALLAAAGAWRLRAGRQEDGG